MILAFPNLQNSFKNWPQNQLKNWLNFALIFLWFLIHFGSPGRSGRRFWRVWGHAGLGFERLGRHVLACLSLRLAFHNIVLFVKSAWPWPVSCQQDLPKCFLNWAVWATCFYRCSTHAFAITYALPSSLLVRRFVRSTWNWEICREPLINAIRLMGGEINPILPWDSLAQSHLAPSNFTPCHW